MRKKHLKAALAQEKAFSDSLIAEVDSITQLYYQTKQERDELRAKLETKGPNRPNRPKLDKSEVAFIKDLVRSGVSRRDVAASFDVNPSTISRIVRGQYHR
ncbi:hypothetical protein PBI_STASIA_45 [Mycobacterium phage Stasia]|uniref:HTH DNA binding protein n=1 Tax=Mycobacterium phage Stasia TaxID=1897548 RepID=A0A1D8EUH7_9CAUD|nr:HTH DNA binding protein [Mycobacterium phage Stasia]AOT24701.1 hypothetical protein PBI_STASIA_45 [Mycobacterium phage Stasia]